MTDMEPREPEIDNLLRRSMAAPIPTLSPDFEQRLLRGLGVNSKALDRYRRSLLTGYGVVSAVTSAVVMRGQGLEWGAILALIVVPAALAATIPWARRVTSTTTQQRT